MRSIFWICTCSILICAAHHCSAQSNTHARDDLSFILAGTSADTTTAITTVDSIEQQKSSQSALPAPAWYEMFTRIPGDYGTFFGEVFQTNAIIPIAGIAASTLALKSVDGRTIRATEVAYNASPFFQTASTALVIGGGGRDELAIAGAFAAYGFIANDNRALRTASETVESFLADGLFVQVLKHITGRQSPLVTTSNGGRWSFFPDQVQYQAHQPNYYSFPSGHIASAMAAVTVVAENYPEAWWIRPVGYAGTACLAASLAGQQYHWWSDFPLGLALGYMFGMIAAHPANAHESKDKLPASAQQSVKISFSPVLFPDGAGASFSVVY